MIELLGEGCSFCERPLEVVRRIRGIIGCACCGLNFDISGAEDCKRLWGGSGLDLRRLPKIIKERRKEILDKILIP